MARLLEELVDIEEAELDELELLLAIGYSVLSLQRKVNIMATDQATFDAALADFLSDLNAGLTAIQAKLDAANVPVDLSAEMGQITSAKAAFDAQVASDTTTTSSTGTDAGGSTSSGSGDAGSGGDTPAEPPAPGDTTTPA